MLPNNFSVVKELLLLELRVSTSQGLSLETKLNLHNFWEKDCWQIQGGHLCTIEPHPEFSGEVLEECCLTRLPREPLLLADLKFLKESLPLMIPLKNNTYLMPWDAWNWPLSVSSVHLEIFLLKSDGESNNLLNNFKTSVKIEHTLGTKEELKKPEELDSRLMLLRLQKLELS